MRTPIQVPVTPETSPIRRAAQVSMLSVLSLLSGVPQRPTVPAQPSPTLPVVDNHFPAVALAPKNIELTPEQKKAALLENVTVYLRANLPTLVTVNGFEKQLQSAIKLYGGLASKDPAEKDSFSDEVKQSLSLIPRSDFNEDFFQRGDCELSLADAKRFAEFQKFLFKASVSWDAMFGIALDLNRKSPSTEEMLAAILKIPGAETCKRPDFLFKPVRELQVSPVCSDVFLAPKEVYANSGSYHIDPELDRSEPEGLLPGDNEEDRSFARLVSKLKTAEVFAQLHVSAADKLLGQKEFIALYNVAVTEAGLNKPGKTLIPADWDETARALEFAVIRGARGSEYFSVKAAVPQLAFERIVEVALIRQSIKERFESLAGKDKLLFGDLREVADEVFGTSLPDANLSPSYRLDFQERVLRGLKTEKLVGAYRREEPRVGYYAANDVGAAILHKKNQSKSDASASATEVEEGFGALQKKINLVLEDIAEQLAKQTTCESLEQVLERVAIARGLFPANSLPVSRLIWRGELRRLLVNNGAISEMLGVQHDYHALPESSPLDSNVIEIKRRAELENELRNYLQGKLSVEPLTAEFFEEVAQAYTERYVEVADPRARERAYRMLQEVRSKYGFTITRFTGVFISSNGFGEFSSIEVVPSKEAKLPPTEKPVELSPEQKQMRAELEQLVKFPVYRFQIRALVQPFLNSCFHAKTGAEAKDALVALEKFLSDHNKDILSANLDGALSTHPFYRNYRGLAKDYFDSIVVNRGPIPGRIFEAALLAASGKAVPTGFDEQEQAALKVLGASLLEAVADLKQKVGNGSLPERSLYALAGEIAVARRILPSLSADGSRELFEGLAEKAGLQVRNGIADRYFIPVTGSIIQPSHAQDIGQYESGLVTIKDELRTRFAGLQAVEVVDLWIVIQGLWSKRLEPKSQVTPQLVWRTQQAVAKDRSQVFEPGVVLLPPGTSPIDTGTCASGG